MSKAVVCLSLILLIIGCETTPPAKIIPASPSSQLIQIQPQMTSRFNVTHVVAPGETLWRISKMYGVNMEDVKRANQLVSSEQLKMGQKLLIPGAGELRPVIAVYPSKKWKYIIIHHSATDEGDSLAFNTHHLKRGFNGVGYHFVIDNGTHGKVNGQIEVSPRWIKQLDGAHCKASDMNYCSIGICLVGNFSKERVSEKQMSSLVYLTGILMDFYQIPLENILGHGQVEGARTDCPGKHFPWREFKSKLRRS